MLHARQLSWARSNAVRGLPFPRSERRSSWRPQTPIGAPSGWQRQQPLCVPSAAAAMHVMLCQCMQLTNPLCACMQCLAVLLAGVLLLRTRAQGSAPSYPQLFAYTAVNEYPHDPTAFTQGLAYDKNGTLEFFWESTGAAFLPAGVTDPCHPAHMHAPLQHCSGQHATCLRSSIRMQLMLPLGVHAKYTPCMQAALEPLREKTSTSCACRASRSRSWCII